MSKKIYLFVIFSIICIAMGSFGGRLFQAEAKSKNDKWPYSEDYEFKVNGKKQKPWKYHSRVYGDLGNILYLDGEFISMDKPVSEDIYIGSEAVSFKYMSREELLDYMIETYPKELEVAVKKYIDDSWYADEMCEEYKQLGLRDYIDQEFESDGYLNDLLTEYSDLGNKDDMLSLLEKYEIEKNDWAFWLPASDKEQSIKIDIKLNGEKLKDNKDYRYVVKVYAGNEVELTPFGEPLHDNTEFDYDYKTLKFDGTNIKVPANWTGAVHVSVERYQSGKSTTYDYIVETIFVVNEVSPKNTEMELYEGRSEKIEITGLADGVTFKSSDENVASVDKKGNVTGVKEGKADITIYKNKKSAGVVKVNVKAPHLMTKRLVLGEGESHELVLWGTDAKITKAVTSDSSVAAVTKKGVITAKKKGTATITVKDSDGRKYKCTVYVWISPSLFPDLIEQYPDYQEHPIGSRWDNNYYYSWKGGKVNPGIGACSGYASLISDAIMGDAKAYYTYDVYNLLPGDVVNVKTRWNGSHYLTIVDVDYSMEKEGRIFYQIFNGNYHYLGSEEGYAEMDYITLSDGILSGLDMEGDGFNFAISRYDENIYKRKVDVKPHVEYGYAENTYRNLTEKQHNKYTERGRKKPAYKVTIKVGETIELGDYIYEKYGHCLNGCVEALDDGIVEQKYEFDTEITGLKAGVCYLSSGEILRNDGKERYEMIKVTVK